MKESQIRNIWMVSREYGDLAGAGGVKDVARQLAETLAKWSGRNVRVVLPFYGFIHPHEFGFDLLEDPRDPGRPLEFVVDMNYGTQERAERCRVWTRKESRVTLYLVESERFREKNGVYTYTEKDVDTENRSMYGRGHYDYFAMNVLLQKSSLELMILLDEHPDVIHCHDGHTALMPALIHECQGWRSYFRHTGCLVTIHNAGVGYHQEVADLSFAQAITGLPWREITGSRLAGKFDPFLCAGRHAIVNTVSENYARELQETDSDIMTDWLGHTLLQNGVKLEGITNGIAPDLFNPSFPEKVGISAAFAPESKDDEALLGKRTCREVLLAQLASHSPLAGTTQYGSVQTGLDGPLFTFIGRLSDQKGVDILLDAMQGFMVEAKTAQLVLLGSGSDEYESRIMSLTSQFNGNGRICFLRGYNPQIANMIYAAGDFFVIPSRYEPCGLTDYIAQLFGNLPIVHHVGGLVKVVDGQTGLAYQFNSVDNLRRCLHRANDLFTDKVRLRTMQREAIRLIRGKYTWEVIMQEYLKLYKRAIERRQHK